MTKNALLSVYDKTGIVEFAEALIALGWTLYSSGGTAKAIAEAGLPVTDVAELTGYPAILGHRVVTLHPKVHGGILARPDNELDQADMTDYGIQPFGLVVANLYPFATDPSIDMIDIGGPTMVRGAAKNHAYVGIVTNPDQYQLVLDELEANDELSDAIRKRLAVEAFAHTARYDLAVVEWLSDQEWVGFLGHRVETLKYGENGPQTAALYSTDDDDSLALHNVDLIEGEARSLVGVTDSDRAEITLTKMAAAFEVNFGHVPLIALGVKHGNACGAAVGDDPITVIKKMIAGDKKAIFGGVIMTNFPITREVAEAMMALEENDQTRRFDGVYAPSFGDGATDILKRRTGKCRIVANPAYGQLDKSSPSTARQFRQTRGGFLLQSANPFVWDHSKSEVRGAKLTKQQRIDATIAQVVAWSSGSNTTTAARDSMLLGNATGQPARVASSELVLARIKEGGHSPVGAVTATDSFYPFEDGPQVLIDAGVSVILATSGGERLPKVIELCGSSGITLALQPDASARGFFGH